MGISPDVEAQLGRLRLGDRPEDALCDLRSLGPECLPDLFHELNGAMNPDYRRALIRVIWEFRDQSAVPVLLKALDDTSDEVCLAALDGLVTISGKAAIEGMRAAANRQEKGTPRRAWVEEAIAQAADAT